MRYEKAGVFVLFKGPPTTLTLIFFNYYYCIRLELTPRHDPKNAEVKNNVFAKGKKFKMPVL